MIEYTADLDAVFSSLADPVRRDILERVAESEYSVSELVACYDLSFAAISKHLMVLEEARLIRKRKDGRKRMISLNPQTLLRAAEYVQQYQPSQGVY